MREGDGQQTLSKTIGFYQLFVLGFGSIIGVGWMIMAGSWVQTAGPVGATAAFVIGALVMLVIALSYAEMAALYPQSGGEVVYAYEGLGIGAAFLIGWLLVLVYITMSIFEAIAVSWILSVLIPGMEGPVLYQFLGSDVTLGATIVAILGIVFLTWINFRGGQSFAFTQNLITWIFLAVSVIFILAGISGGKAKHAIPLFASREGEHYLLGFISVLATIPVWFSGFNTISQCLGEVKDIEKVKYFYRLLIAVLFAALLFYIGIIWSTSLSVPRETLLTLNFPVAESIRIALESRMLRDLVLLAGLLGIITSWNAMFYSGSRVVYCLSRARLFSSRFAEINPKYGSPAAAVLLIGFCSLIGVFIGRNGVEPLTNLVGSLISLAYLFTSLAMFWLRVSRNNLPRPYRVPGGYFLPVLSVVLSLGLTALSVVNIWVSRQNVFPLEFLILGGWGVLSLASWFFLRKERNSITNEERRALIQLR